MFHGPRSRASPSSPRSASGTCAALITTPAAPGALLDNVGQLLGYWIMADATERTDGVPGRHGRDPLLRAASRARQRSWSAWSGSPRSPTPSLEADMQLVPTAGCGRSSPAGRTAGSTTTRRPAPVERFPGRNTLSQRAAGRLVAGPRALAGPGHPRTDHAQPPRRRGTRRSTTAPPAARPAAVAAGPDRRQGRGPTAGCGTDGDGRGLPGRDRGRATTTPGGPCVPASTAGPARADRLPGAPRRDRGRDRAGAGPCGIDIEEVAERPASHRTRSRCGPAELELLAG